MLLAPQPSILEFKETRSPLSSSSWMIEYSEELSHYWCERMDWSREIEEEDWRNSSSGSYWDRCSNSDVFSMSLGA